MSNRRLVQTAGEEECLLKNIWMYLNPYSNETIEKAAVFDFMLLLMFNVLHQSERGLQQIIADHLILYYNQFDIFLKIDGDVKLFDQNSKDVTQENSI